MATDFRCGGVAVVALAGMSTITHRPTELLEGHITRTPSRVPDIPIYGMGYNDMCFPALYSPSRQLVLVR